VTTPTVAPAGVSNPHPLDALTGAEIERAVAVVRDSGRLTAAAIFSYIALDEPPKSVVAAHRDGDAVDRRVRLQIVPGPQADVIEAVVSIADGRLRSWDEMPGMRPALLFGESITAIAAVQGDERWLAALRSRGIDSVDQVQIDPWPAGTFGLPIEDGRRITRCISYFRETPTDNGYARPIEGLIAFVDMATGEVLDVVDYGSVPLPPGKGSYYPQDVGPLRDDLRPLEITQPQGPSFEVDGNRIRWQRWSLRVGFDACEGLVLHTVGYDDGGRVRPILHRASVSEMVVPYGDPGPMHGWKNAFDAGEWGLGRLANSLTEGCDCLGAITYFDAILTNEQGMPYPLANAICLHEEDYGILWKHVDLQSGTTEVRRSRRLVISSIATVGNYEYGFYWYLYMDGTIQFEVKLTGIMSTRAVAEGERPPEAPLVAPGLAAPVHQHMFNVRLDLDVDGTTNEVYEIETLPMPPGPDNPWSNGFLPHATRLVSEQQAQRVVDSSRSRYWKFVNPDVRNGLGEPVAYKLVPGATPTLLADPSSSVGRRAAFATKNLWVTPFTADERRAAGEYPNQHAGGDGLPRWTAADRSLEGTDIVAWYTFGVTHVPRPEDWPVMPVEYAGFHLAPVGFFDRNPALDVPPGEPACHHG
jgi:primary-amine oxidase